MSAKKIQTTHLRIPRHNGTVSLRALLESLPRQPGHSQGEQVFGILVAYRDILENQPKVGQLIDNPLRDGYATRTVSHPDGTTEVQHFQRVE